MNRSSDLRRSNKTQTNDSYEYDGENTFRYTMAAETSCEETSLIERLQVLGTVKTTPDDDDDDDSSSLALPHKSRVSVHLPLVVSRASQVLCSCRLLVLCSLLMVAVQTNRYHKTRLLSGWLGSVPCVCWRRLLKLICYDFRIPYL